MTRQAKGLGLSCILTLIFSTAIFADGFIVIPPPFPRPVTYTATPYPLEVKLSLIHI